MEKNFDKIIEFILSIEGGYVNNPNDPGGETKYGISKRRYPNLDIKNLTKEQAKQLYYKDYWHPSKSYALPSRIDAIHFDAAVNLGIKRANKLLQQSVNNISKHKLIVDGIIGPKTLGTIVAIKDYKLLEKEYLLQRIFYYFKIGRRLRKFFYGWIARIVKLSKFIGGL